MMGTRRKGLVLGADGEPATPTPLNEDAPPVAKLRHKLNLVRSRLQRIQKRGVNKNQAYAFVRETDVTEAVAPLLIEHNLSLTVDYPPEHTGVLAQRDKTAIVGVLAVYSIMDLDTGHEMVMRVPGHGMDGGDKAVYKAMTGAGKYALLKLFLIPTGDDPEQDAPKKKNDPPAPAGKAGQPSPEPQSPGDPNDPISQVQRERLIEIAKQQGHKPTGVTAWLWAKYGVENMSQVSKGIFPEVAKRLGSSEPFKEDA